MLVVDKPASVLAVRLVGEVCPFNPWFRSLLMTATLDIFIFSTNLTVQIFAFGRGESLELR